MPEFISSHSNPLVKQIRSLRQKKSRQELDLFLVEGIHHVGEVLEAGWDLQTLVYAPDLLSSDFARRIVEDQSRRGVPCIPLTSDLFADIAEKDNPQGLLAVVHQKHLKFEDPKLEHFQFGAALISPQDPGNVGTILRTLDAVAADGLFLLEGGVELYHPSVVRASMGTLFWKPVVQSSINEFDQWRRKNGCRLIGSSAHAPASDRAYRWENKPTILLLGNEQKGLSPEQISICDEMVSLPMKGRVSSLNLAVAAGILLYQMMENK
jgi:RNA methyltransferase, TrmH family